MQLVSKYNLQTLQILHLRSFELGIMSNSLSLGSQRYHYVENTASNRATEKKQAEHTNEVTMQQVRNQWQIKPINMEHIDWQK